MARILCLVLLSVLVFGVAASVQAKAEANAGGLASGGVAASPVSSRTEQPLPTVHVDAVEVLQYVPYLLIPVLLWMLWRILGGLLSEFGTRPTRRQGTRGRTRPTTGRIIRGGSGESVRRPLRPARGK